MKAIAVLLVVVGIAASGVAYYTKYLNADPSPTYRTAQIKRDDLLVTIGATGTAEPEDLIDVGAQVTGKIEKFGDDLNDKKIPKKQIDYGTAVEKGWVLAVIDPTIYKAQFDQATASLTHARADLVQLQAKCVQAEQDWKRAQALLPEKAIADTDYDLARANYRVAQANIDVGQATIDQCQAALELAKTNLNYTTITSPVKGVIIARRMNVGQTVMAALNAPSLFLLAKDLSRMQIWAQVNEADIGHIRPGMRAFFTLDTYPGETFEGKVQQIRLNGQNTQNVVTYTVVVATDNPPSAEYPYGKIFPYMTANLKFEVERHKDVLQVPNGALRYKPSSPQIAGEAHAKASGTNDGGDAAKPSDAAGGGKKQAKHQRIWVLEDGVARSIKVEVGATDGSMTEISGDEVKEGMEVVIGESRGAGSADDGTKNPFLPNIRPGGTQQKPKS
jgi:HlyD family secretion protein